MALFPGAPRWAGARRELLTLWCKGRLTEADTPTMRLGRHSIRTNQCPPPPSPHFFTGRCIPTCKHQRTGVKEVLSTDTAQYLYHNRSLMLCLETEIECICKNSSSAALKVSRWTCSNSEQVVNVSWHKATAPPQTHGSTVFARCRQCSLYWGHIDTTWQIRLNLCFLLCTGVHNPNGKSTGSAIFAQLTAKCPWARLGMSFPLIIAPFHRGSGPHTIHASLGPPESITQMAPRSVQPFLHSSHQCHRACLGMPFCLKIAPFHGKTVTYLVCGSLGSPDSASRLVQPFLHRWPQSVPILYNGLPFLRQNCPFPWGHLDPHLIHDSLGPAKPKNRTASGSVQLFLNRWRKSIPILYNGLPLSPWKLPFPSEWVSSFLTAHQHIIGHSVP